MNNAQHTNYNFVYSFSFHWIIMKFIFKFKLEAPLCGSELRFLTQKHLPTQNNCGYQSSPQRWCVNNKINNSQAGWLTISSSHFCHLSIATKRKVHSSMYIHVVIREIPSCRIHMFIFIVHVAKITVDFLGNSKAAWALQLEISAPPRRTCTGTWPLHGFSRKDKSHSLTLFFCSHFLSHAALQSRLCNTCYWPVRSHYHEQRKTRHHALLDYRFSREIRPHAQCPCTSVKHIVFTFRTNYIAGVIGVRFFSS